MNKATLDIWVRIEPGSDNVGMENEAIGDEGGRRGASFEEEWEGEVIGPGLGLKQGTVEGEGFDWGFSGGKAADEDIVLENGGKLEVGELLEDLGVDLVEVFGVLAGFEEGLEMVKIL